MAKTTWEIKTLDRDVRDLEPRAYPYFHHIGRNKRLGIRKLQNGTATWIGEYKVKGKGQQYRIGEVGPKLGYDTALARFNDWVEKLTGLGPITVREACEDYLKRRQRDINRRKGKGGKYAYATGNRFNRMLALGDIADKDIRELLPEDLNRFQDAQEDASRNKNPHTLRRDFRQFMAAIRWAAKQKRIENPTINEFELDKDQASDIVRREAFSEQDFRKLIEAADPAVRAVCLAIYYTGCRPGMEGILAAKAGDIRKDEKGITWFHGVHYKGCNRPTPFACPLSNEAVAFFKRQAFGKLPGAPLFTSPDGTPWGKNQFGRWFKKALKDAGLPLAWVPYMIRHLAITQWVNLGIPPMTIGKWTGTSSKEIEKHYYDPQKGVEAHLALLNKESNQ